MQQPRPVTAARPDRSFDTRTSEERERLEPAARFLLSKVDGRADVKALLWCAPLREVDALRTLRNLIDGGILGVTRSGAGRGAECPR